MAHEARGPFIIMRGGPGVLSDRPMGGLTAGGGEERGSILLCSMHDPCGVQKFAADGREERDAFPT